MPSGFVALHSPRLTLRPIERADAERFAAYRSRPEVARYQFWESLDEAEAIRIVERQQSTVPGAPGSWFQFVIVETSSASIVGDCAIHFKDDDARQVEIGVNLAPEHGGQGFANEALTRLLGTIFDDLAMHRVLAVTDADNAAASALFRRLGFRQEAHFVEHLWFKGAYGSEYLFAMLRREWTARHGR